MKYKELFLKPFLLAGSLLFLLSCAQDTPPKEAAPSGQLTEAQQANPFPFYKDISVRPGLNFEVLSWGKGVDSVGGYLILMTDSAKNDFKSLSNEREGIISDAWNMDLDNDGNPEVYIELKSNKDVLDLNVFEYSRNGFQKNYLPRIKQQDEKDLPGKGQIFHEER
jgi:hypothetical protein